MATNPVGKFLPVERSTRFTANRASSKNRGDGFAFVADGEGAAAGADDGFEIGNHTRHHHAVNGQKAAQIEADVTYIEEQCAAHQIPRPTSFCYPGYATSPTAVPLRIAKAIA